MTHSRRMFTAMAIALAALLPMTGQAQSPSDPPHLLIGKWRHDTLLRVIDGTHTAEQPAQGNASVEFKPDGTWIGTSGTLTSSGKYRWIDKKHIEQKYLESGVPGLIGSVATNEVKVTATRLEMTSTHKRSDIDKYAPPKRAGGAPDNIVVTISFKRMP